MQLDTMRISTLGAWQDVRHRAGPAAHAPAALRPFASDAFVPRPAAPAPAAVATPAALPAKPKPRPAGPLAGFALRKGSTFAIAPGTTVRGHQVTGTARVVAVSADHVELRMRGAAAGGLVDFDVRFKAAKQADGSIKLTADMLDAQGGVARSLLDQKAQVLSAAAGDLKLRVADGKQARLASVAKGLRIQVADLDVDLVRTA